MSTTNLELVTYAFLKINVIDENSAPSPEQGVTALNVLNDMLASAAADGVHLGWYPQTNIAAISPLQNQDVGPVKYLLCAALAAHYGIKLSDELIAQIGAAATRLEKRALKYSEADMSEIPRPEGPWWYGGGMGWGS
jgi:hypothetical protein